MTIKTEKKVTVDHVQQHAYKPELNQAQIRQDVETAYPTRQVNNDLFANSEFNLENKTYTSTRVAWIDVPLTATKEIVEERLSQNPNARIQRVLSSVPIFTDNEKSARRQGIINDEAHAKMIDSQIVRNEAGVPVPYTGGAVQYRRYFFTTDGKVDIDSRTNGTTADVPFDEGAQIEIASSSKVTEQQTV